MCIRREKKEKWTNPGKVYPTSASYHRGSENSNGQHWDGNPRKTREGGCFGDKHAVIGFHRVSGGDETNMAATQPRGRKSPDTLICERPFCNVTRSVVHPFLHRSHQLEAPCPGSGASTRPESAFVGATALDPGRVAPLEGKEAINSPSVGAVKGAVDLIFCGSMWEGRVSRET